MSILNNYCHNSAGVRLFSRSEGRIKSFESCNDLRAWSHDIGKRDHYLREWIKYDMPICVIPTSTLVCILRKMTYSNRGNVAPQCHPRCKSKVVLESICASCHAMKECFRNEENFDKYFEDEEFETSDWPCEKCLDALKSIKMFWKIIIDKLFCGNEAKRENLPQTNKTCYIENALSVVKVWQNDMLQQASFVKNIMPLLKGNTSWKGLRPSKVDSAPCRVKTNKLDDSKIFVNAVDEKLCKTTNTMGLPNTYPSHTKIIKPSSHKQILAKMQTNDIACECTSVAKMNECNVNLEFIHEKFKSQKNVIEKLKKENGSLKMELKKYKNVGWKSWYSASNPTPSIHESTTNKSLPKSFKCCPYENGEVDIEPIDSEMLITLKRCKDESYNHISLLQVLHKTNARNAVINNICSDKWRCKKEDPVELLTKVQHTFGAIVDREMSLANDRTSCSSTLDIDASYHKVKPSKTEPSCFGTTLSSSDLSEFSGELKSLG